jgi:hypothetical protein
LHFGRFQGNGRNLKKNELLTAQLHMAYDIPTRFHKFDEGISEKSSGQKQKISMEMDVYRE